MTHDVEPLTKLPTDLVHDIVAGAWVPRATCVALDLDPEETSDAEMLDACSVCPVARPCLYYANLVDARHFVFGGHTPEQRKALDNGQRYSVCQVCGCGYVWEKVGRSADPERCATCNTHNSTRSIYAHRNDHANN